MMTGTKFDIEKFDGKNDYGLWQVRMKALLEQQGLASTLKELPAATIVAYDSSQSEHIDEFQKLVETLLYGRDTLKLEDVLATLNSRELQKMTEAKGDGGEGEEAADSESEEHLKRDSPRYNHKKSQGFVRNDQVSGYGAMVYNGGNILLSDGRECRARGTGKVQVHMRDGSSFVLDNVRYVPKLRRNLISLGSLKKRAFYREDVVGQYQGYKGFASSTIRNKKG
ncbi:hypothetical protein Tco_1063910 [Tanacetum coccineum]